MLPLKFIPVLMALKELVPRLMDMAGQAGPLKQAVSDLQSTAQRARESQTMIAGLSQHVSRLELQIGRLESELHQTRVELAQKLDRGDNAESARRLRSLSTMMTALTALTGLLLVLVLVLLLRG